MNKIIVMPENKIVWCKKDETILQASLRVGIPHFNACGGVARCSTCRVDVVKGLKSCEGRSEDESILAQRMHFPQNTRLACQTKISGDVIIKRRYLDEIDKKIVIHDNARQPLSLKPLGVDKKLAVMFTDLEGYTSFSERYPPYDVVHVLNRYFHCIGKIIESYKGRIIDYYGDGVLILFGLSDIANPSLNAVKTALEIQKSMTELNVYLKYLFNETLRVRSGIDFGHVIMGQIGYSDQIKLAAIGDHVNTAARLEQKNKKLKTSILLSQCAFREVKEKAIIKNIYKIKMNGKKGRYRVFEVIDIKNAEERNH